MPSWTPPLTTRFSQSRPPPRPASAMTSTLTASPGSITAISGTTMRAIRRWVSRKTNTASIMANPAVRAAHLADITGPGGLYTDIANRTLPAVSIVKPSGFVDGHPSSSKLNLFEGFTQKIVMAIQGSPYWKDTAIFITFDEGGGY